MYSRTFLDTCCCRSSFVVNHCLQLKCYCCQCPHLHANAKVEGKGAGVGIGKLFWYVLSIIVSAADIVGHCRGLCDCQFGLSSRGLRRLWWPQRRLWWWIWGLWWIWRRLRRWLRRLRRTWWWLSWLKYIQTCTSPFTLFHSPDFILLGFFWRRRPTAHGTANTVDKLERHHCAKSSRQHCQTTQPNLVIRWNKFITTWRFFLRMSTQLSLNKKIHLLQKTFSIAFPEWKMLYDDFSLKIAPNVRMTIGSQWKWMITLCTIADKPLLKFLSDLNE